MKTKSVERGCGWLLLGLVLVSPAALAAKTDVVEFAGSRMVGEVKQLDRGKLSFKTDSTGTIEIDWADVTRLETRQQLRVERRNGRVTLASLSPTQADRTLVLDSETGRDEVEMRDVVAFEPLEDGFWDRLDISTSFGYSFTKSNGVEQLNFSANVSYDTEQRSRQFNATSQVSSSSDADESVRRTVDFNSLRYSNTRYFTGYQIQYEDNDALNLDYRVLGAWLLGRAYFPLANQRWRAFTGIDISEERFNEQSSRWGSELIFGTTIDWYKFRSPELDLSSSIVLFPSITDWGRVRASFDLSLRWEIFDDLFWEVSVYDDFDSRAYDSTTDTNDKSNDYGISTSIGWSL
ncbi:MAG: DUF481 domain-containing protein [Pseudomonadales bacterium]